MDEDDRDSNASSDNDQDEVMDDVDDMEVDNDPEEEENEDEEEDDAEQDDDEPPDQADNASVTVTAPAPDQGADDTNNTAVANPTITQVPATPKNQSGTPSGTPRWKPVLRPEVVNAKLYDIVPTMAAPQATSINAISITPDMRYWMTGGSDGYIRKYDGVGTINGKQLLTVAQRHPFVESVTKAGLLMSYWENPASPDGKADDTLLSPVYSLAIHSQALWCLAGTETGGINMQTVRHWEGTRITCLQKHTNAVSVLNLAQDERSVLSGSWDKSIHDWDLENGQIKRSFDGSGSQISAIELRPASGAPIPPDSYDEPVKTDSFSNNAKPLPNGMPNGTNGTPNGLTRTNTMGADAVADSQASPAHESLFGGGSDAGSLFGDNEGMNVFGGDDENEFSRAMEMSLQDSSNQGSLHNPGDMAMDLVTFDAESGPPPAVQPLDSLPGDNSLGDATMSWSTTDAPDPVLALSQPDNLNGAQPTQDTTTDSTLLPTQASAEATNFPPAADTAASLAPAPILFAESGPSHLDPSQSSDSTFFSTSIDGTIRIWDRRVANPIARIGNRPGVPPWCMGACWSPNGNTIYAGRRNGTVEEFSIHKARRGWEPERVFKFPAGSGPVSAVRSMVNGRHLVCASHDILRLYDLREQAAFKHSTVPFLIIPGPPRAGVISALWIDPTSRFMVSAAGTRGWEGTSTETIIGYEIGVVNK